MKTAQQLFDEAFGSGREPRSDEYKAGALALLRSRICDTPLRHPHPLGTVESDAWLAGLAEGREIFRAAREKGEI